MMRSPLSNSSTHRLLRAGVIAALVTAAGACGGSAGTGGDLTPTTPTTPTTPSSPSAPVATNSVTLTGSAFSPSDIQVTPGAVVTFTNIDKTAHNVTFASSAVASIGDYTEGDRTVVMPTTTGTYAYHCTIHAGMSGSVLVK